MEYVSNVQNFVSNALLIVCVFHVISADRDLFCKKINVKQVAVKDIFNKTIQLSTILKFAANVNKTV
jgi:hypothetical protein